MLVSAVSMNGVIPAVKNSPKSNSNYASTAQSHDTFQKSGVSFGINRETLLKKADELGAKISGSETKREIEARIAAVVEQHGSEGKAKYAAIQEKKTAKRARKEAEARGGSSSSSSSDSSSSSSNSKYGDEPFYWSVMEDHCP